MTSPDEASPPSLQEADLLEAQRRRRRTTLAALGLGAAAALGLGAFFMKRADQAAKDERDRALGALSACLLGPEVPVGGAPSLAFRRQQLRVIGVPKDKRAKIGEIPFPQSCAAPAHKLAETLKGVEPSKGDDTVAGRSEKLASLLKDDKSIATDLSALVDGVLSGAAALGLRPAGEAEAPPSEARPLDAPALAKAEALAAKSFSLASVRPAAFATEDGYFLLDDKDIPNGPALCASPSGSTSIQCEKLGPAAAARSPGLRLWGATEPGARPYVFAGDRGAAGIFEPSGAAPLAATMTYGAYAAKDGALALLSWDEREKKVVLTRYAGGKPAGEAEDLFSLEDVGNPYYNVGLLWDELVWKARGGDDGGLKLHVRPVASAGDGKKTVTVGELAEASLIEQAEEDPHVAGCRTAEATIARVKGWSNEQLAFRVGGKWLPPVLAEGLGGAMSCRGSEATIARVRGRRRGEDFEATLVLRRCTAAGCRATELPMKQILGAGSEVLPKSERQVDAVEVGGAVVLVWTPGPEGGLRMRVAPAERLEGAKDVIVYDDLVAEDEGKGKGGLALGRTSTLFETKLLPRANDAILFTSTAAGVHALRVDPATGTATPMRVAWKSP